MKGKFVSNVDTKDAKYKPRFPNIANTSTFSQLSSQTSLTESVSILSLHNSPEQPNVVKEISEQRKAAILLLEHGLRYIRQWPKRALRVFNYVSPSAMFENTPAHNTVYRPIISRRTKRLLVQILKLERPVATKTVHLRNKRHQMLREHIPKLDRMETIKCV